MLKTQSAHKEKEWTLTKLLQELSMCWVETSRCWPLQFPTAVLSPTGPSTRVVNQIFSVLLLHQIPHCSSADETAQAERESALVPPFHGPLQKTCQVTWISTRQPCGSESYMTGPETSRRLRVLALKLDDCFTLEQKISGNIQYNNKSTWDYTVVRRVCSLSGLVSEFLMDFSSC